MKRHLVLLLLGSTLLGVAVAQTDSGETGGRRAGSGTGDFGGIRPTTQEIVYTNAKNLPRFSLDFPGGKPKDLVRAIEKAMGKPLNVVIPQEYAGAELPPLTVKNVTVAQLFQALEQASQKQEPFVTAYASRGSGSVPTYQFINTGYAFRTAGDLTENSIWYFHWEKVPELPWFVSDKQPPAICRFYQLGMYLDSGYKVEDITTAIETGWKMLGETDPPKISYHKDTKLLIAVGTEKLLSLIQNVLNQLPLKPKAAPTPSSAPPAKANER